MARVVKVSLRTEDDLQQLLGRLSLPGLVSWKVVAQKQKLPETASDWQGMPEYNQKLRGCAAKLLITVDSVTLRQLEEILEQKIPPIGPKGHNIGVWYPRKEREVFKDLCYSATKLLLPLYPIYIPSKGRFKSRLTSRVLERLGVPYYMVVEPQEYEDYARVIDPAKILKLPFSNLGQGSIPARNWIFRHSLENGHAKHWILDDNIRYLLRRNNGVKIRCETANVFRAAEDYAARYENVAMAGFNYQQFAINYEIVPPVRLNTRVYSCILVDNLLAAQVLDNGQLWRGKYNEDTDLSLRCLKAGLCTLLFNAFLIMKGATMKMKGGNTEEVYENGAKRKDFAESLAQQHPDVTKVVQRFSRWHHQVDYRPFAGNALIPCPSIVPSTPNNYAMFLDELTPERYKEMLCRDGCK